MFHDDLFDPFGDPRACSGSISPLPGSIAPDGIPIPSNATDIHYETQESGTSISFVTTSDALLGYLRQTGLIPAGRGPSDDSDGLGSALAAGPSWLPDGLCGDPLTDQMWEYSGRFPNGQQVTVYTEVDFVTKTFRQGPRVVIEMAP